MTNKKSHHVGVSVGVDKADFPTLGIMSGAQNALAIIANRFSFVFNLKGPNYICDTVLPLNVQGEGGATGREWERAPPSIEVR